MFGWLSCHSRDEKQRAEEAKEEKGFGIHD